MFSRVAVAWRHCSWRFSMVIMPFIRWGHVWRSVGCYPCSSPASHAPRSMITGWGRFSLRCLPLNRVCGAIALNALEVYALSTPWLHQETTTIRLYGAYEEEARTIAGLAPPRPAYGHCKDGPDDLKQVLLSLGVSSEGLSLRMGVRDGNTHDSTETPVAIEEGLALG